MQGWVHGSSQLFHGQIFEWTLTVRRAPPSEWLPLLVTSCVREDAHVTEAQRGHPRHAQVHRHDTICDHVPWDPYYPRVAPILKAALLI